MKNTSKHLFWIIPLVMVIAGIVAFAPSAHVDLSKDEAPFSAIVLPPQSVNAGRPISSEAI